MIVQSVLLRLAPAEAFALFTRRIDEWWPADRRHTKGPGSRVILLPVGRLFERAGDGREIELGRVIQWDEPRRILLDFYVATGPDRPTQVEITFEAEGPCTRVTVTHGPKPESADVWDDRVPRYGDSWRAVLAALQAFVVREGLDSR